jgi:hypothetical protein
MYLCANSILSYSYPRIPCLHHFGYSTHDRLGNTIMDLGYLLSSSLTLLQAKLLSYLRATDLLPLTLVLKCVHATLKQGKQGHTQARDAFGLLQH